ncbi:MAG: Nif11-like leader peptide family RiPP precursor [Candidatus Riflebacteria bacterium]|nr:Nif11-like leader peptide family RiPP precursor [Candidatus Riflebacteria bacterium]
MDSNLKLEQVMEMLNRDERFAKKLFAEETPEGAQKILRQAGIDFTLEEIRQIARQACEAQERKGKELDDSELESVAGGGGRGKYKYANSWAGINHFFNVELPKFFQAW